MRSASGRFWLTFHLPLISADLDFDADDAAQLRLDEALRGVFDMPRLGPVSFMNSSQLADLLR